MKYIYEKVADKLLEKIKKGFYGNGKLPPERELSGEFNINRITLRKALKNLEGISAIHRLGRKGTFIDKRFSLPDAMNNMSFAFFLVKRDEFDPVHSNNLMYLQKELSKYDSILSFYSVSDEKEATDILRKHHTRIDGIFISGLVTEAILLRVKESGIPVVMIGHMIYQNPVEEETDRVIIDSFGYGRGGTTKLIERGCGKIALVKGPAYQHFANMNFGYMKALEEHGIEYDESMVLNCPRDTSEAAEKMFSEWLKNNSAPDAVFAGNERLIDGVKRIIWKEYPDTEIQFMSVSNSISQKESPWTIFIPPEKVAAVASDIMSRRLLNRDYKASYKEIIETEPGK